MEDEIILSSNITDVAPFVNCIVALFTVSRIFPVFGIVGIGGMPSHVPFHELSRVTHSS